MCASPEFTDEIDIMRSLARPRKLTITGSDGKTYIFLGKPKDDLRKDARLMDFNAIINKQLKSNSESRRRQLCTWYRSLPYLQVAHYSADIRTYGVVTLNEECGFIQWVPDTIPMRSPIQKSYLGRGISTYVCGCVYFGPVTLIHGSQDNRCQAVFDKLGIMREKDAAELFKKEVLPT